ncbi:hypothetical protein COX24_03380 [bacterium (Candidatus Gribaldobacteria) CG23_combo_of_CG06-09_8_20_14_all_37_87_8]|uniref:Glycosyl transferase family 1 domain-containing protein n=1 Tax=bacterium (Candidatus Gribaldobacteria) CG23_combo_of_CG06-09_8_20_14_all_37_87_8 TaxID=2014278 RepID=A0A2G9ZE85_9BACT|nr:MAG: hypothetical protein COX24_03380 [bacterium (Candidatus Gribaldobacteria) CG23_combo_of_CG06-09_8_20_14_all_37_87_8]
MKFVIFNNGLMVETGLSGSDRRALEWTKIFLKKGFKVNMYTSVFGRTRYQNFGPNLSLTTVGDSKFISQNTFFIYLFRAVRSIFLIRNVGENDIFYSTSDLLPDAVPAFFGKLKNKKTKWLTGCHLLATNPFRDYKGNLKKPTLKGIYYFFSQKVILLLAKNYADLVMVSNNLDRNSLLGKGFKDRQVIVTYGAVEWGLVNSVKPQKTKYEAAFIGRYHPQKGLDDLLKAWKIVCRKFPKAQMAMIGELEQLLPKIKELGLGTNIIFFGFIDGVDKVKILRSSKIFLFPSHYESFGIVAAEAMALGLPVVAYDLPIYKDIYPEGMIKVPLGNWRSFADEVGELLTNKSKYKKISVVAIKVAKKFSWEKTAKTIIDNLGVTSDKSK